MQRSFNRVADATGRVRLEQERYDALLEAGETDRARLIQQSERLAAARRAEENALRTASSAHRDYGRSVRDLGNSFTTSTRDSAGGVTQLGTALAALGRVATPATLGVISGAILQLGSIAASAAQSVLVLPGAIGALGTAFGTLKLATLGIGDAFENIGDPEKFAESLRELAPSAQQFMLSVQGMMPALRELQQATQGAFFEGFGAQANRVVSQYLPMIRQATTDVAGAFNQMFSGVADQLMTPETQRSIQSFLQNVTSAFQALAPAMAPMTQALTQLMEIGSGVLPQIAQGATNAANAFASWVSAKSATGELQQWLNEGLATLKDLVSIAWGFGQAFMSLAPTAREVLPQIVKLLEDTESLLPAITVAATASAGPFLVWAQHMRGIGMAVEALKPLVESVGNVVIGIVNRIGETIDRMLEPIRAAISAANAISPVDLPNIPRYSGISPLDLSSGGVDSFTGALVPGGPLGITYQNALGGPAGASRERRGEAPVNPLTGLPSLPGAGLFPGADAGTGWWHPSAVGNPNQLQQEYEARMDALDEAGRPGAKTPEGLTPNAAQLQQVLQQMFPGLQVNADVGRQDKFGEHSSGEALDIMVGNNRVLGEQLNRWLLQNAESFGLQYNLWRQAQWDPSGEIRPMPDRGDPTQNHMDHIHARVRPGEAASGNYMPLGAHPYQSGVQGVNVESFGSSAQSDLNGLGGQLGAQLDQDFGISKGLPGLAENAVKFVGNLFFAPLLTALQALAGGRDAGSGLIGMAAAAGGYGGGARGGAMGTSPMFGPSPSAMGPAALQPPWSADWNAIAQGESGGNWGINTGNGYSGGLQFSPSSWEAAGGTQFAPSAYQATPYQQALTAEELLRMQGPGAWPNTFVPGSSGPAAPGAPGGPGILGLPFGGGGSMLPGAGMPQGAPQGAPLTTGGMAYPAVGGGGFQGMGGLPMSAVSSAVSAGGLAIDAMAPGAGQAAAAAAQIGIQLANRAIGYAGQVAGIAVSGIGETLSLGDNPMGSLGKSWIGRLAGGFAGARPSLPNMAGQAAPPTPAAKDPRAAAQQGLAAAKGGDTNITVNNNRPTEDGTGRDIAWHVYSPAGRQ
ncbi:transglycosylase family protein [Mycolicibacterium austroafricanum]|uniref:Transglycosylase family protein n=1 Tax=Mycolicibacterium austroafricanum TaxID=39687 RepID=A0ABT8HKQ4_MYCAO|nr:transglycosylase family protein [Mycolicibacterium austroafricanum]MDN4521351.1 transglycosylase family protein [Mycolicibacterium austroafricanum]